jgi:hypothetical protein
MITLLGGPRAARNCQGMTRRTAPKAGVLGPSLSDLLP